MLHSKNVRVSSPKKRRHDSFEDYKYMMTSTTPEQEEKVQIFLDKPQPTKSRVLIDRISEKLFNRKPSVEYTESIMSTTREDIKEVKSIANQLDSNNTSRVHRHCRNKFKIGAS